MKHLFVPYELALLAKEKWFNESCFMHWIHFYKDLSPYLETTDFMKDYFIRKEIDNYGINAPIHQQLIDYLRINHNLFIKIDNFTTDFGVDYDYCVCELDAEIDGNGHMTYLVDYDVNRSFSYHEALNKAIEVAFKLI